MLITFGSLITQNYLSNKYQHDFVLVKKIFDEILPIGQKGPDLWASLFLEEISSYTAVHMRYVMDACGCV